jgi:FkbM family methyltransferase
LDATLDQDHFFVIIDWLKIRRPKTMLCKSDLEDDIASYIAERLPEAKMEVVFDVGANIGWFTYVFMKQFRECEFYLFEPVTSIFEQIRPNLEKHASLYHPFPRVKPFRQALGMAIESGNVTKKPNVTINHVILGVSEPNEEVETVEINTGDAFCDDNNIPHIDYLKIDSEGFDMKVLIGFKSMLDRQAIDFVQIEASLSDENKNHINIASFEGLLSSFGYKKFRYINQASSHNKPVLERADVVFISSNAAEKYSRRPSR